jgi:predicted nucleotidyltransferase
MNKDEFVKRVRNAGIERDEERRIYAAGVLNEALKKHGTKVTVVGGSIVAIFTAGHYTTADIDIVARKPEIVKQVLGECGFTNVSGIRYVHEDLGLILEYMGEIPKAERIDTIKVKEVEVDIISIEDVLVSKLEMLEKGTDVEKSETQVKIIAYLLGNKINEDAIRDRLIRENLWELWTRIKAEVDEYGP